MEINGLSPLILRRERGLAPLCGAESTGCGFSKDPSRLSVSEGSSYIFFFK